jgi:hypothetical protein
MKSISELLGLSVDITKVWRCYTCVASCRMESKQWRNGLADISPPTKCPWGKEDILKVKWSEV